MFNDFLAKAKTFLDDENIKKLQGDWLLVFLLC